MKYKLLVFLCLLSCSAFSQVRPYELGPLKFEVTSNYAITEKDSEKVIFHDTVNVGGIRILKEIELANSGIDPEANGIKTIFDLTGLDVISALQMDNETEDVINGITELENKQIYYSQKLYQVFSNNGYTELIGYSFVTEYYFFVGSQIFQLNYRSELLNPDNRMFDQFEISKTMKRQSNIGDLNKILKSLKAKK